MDDVDKTRCPKRKSKEIWATIRKIKTKAEFLGLSE